MDITLIPQPLERHIGQIVEVIIKIPGFRVEKIDSGYMLYPYEKHFTTEEELHTFLDSHSCDLEGNITCKPRFLRDVTEDYIILSHRDGTGEMKIMRNIIYMIVVGGVLVHEG